MSRVELNANVIGTAPAIKRRSVLASVHALPVLATLAVVALAGLLGWAAWQYYMGTPWTRDGTVRAYVVKVAPQVAGEIVSLPIADNQFVRKGDLLMLIDPRNYSIAIRQAQAAAEQAQAIADNARAEMIRREKLTDIAVTMEERQTYISQATTAEATYQSALANLEQARINYKRTQVRSPVNGYVTNLSAQLGNYADVGSLQLSLVNSNSYWVDAYFEETALSRIQEGDAATIKLMGYTPLLRGRVQGLARGIDVPNSAPDASGLASVNPIFTFVRLAQRVPVRVHIDEVPEGVNLVAGMTATVQIEPYKAPPVSSLKPAPLNVGQADVPPASFQTLTDAAPQTSPPEVVKQAATTPAPPRAIRQSASDAGRSAARRRTGDFASDPTRTARNHPQRLPLPISCRCPSRPRRRPPLRRERPPPISRRSSSRLPPIRRPAPGRSLRCRQANIWDRLTTFSAVKARRRRRSRGLQTRSEGALAPDGVICRRDRHSRGVML